MGMGGNGSPSGLARSSRWQEEMGELEKRGGIQGEKQKDLGCYDKEIWDTVLKKGSIQIN